jgi:phosphoglucomutase
MAYYDEYHRWRTFKEMDPILKKELDAIADMDEAIRDRFDRELAFGTGGIRGEMGAGPARINIYLIRKATCGLAAYLREVHVDKPHLRVCIAYDTRHNSLRFAHETAGVLASAGIQTWLFPQPAPTPMLSFAVRQLEADAGIVITASHNPPKDNGYKVYGPDGGQITDGFANAVMKHINQVKDMLSVSCMDGSEGEGKGLIRWIGPEIEEMYLKYVQDIGMHHHWWTDIDQPVKIVYTPLHGTGAITAPKVLSNVDFVDFVTVPEQMIMDASCPSIAYPNPEDWNVYDLAIRLGQSVGADLLMATDLDGDRLGVAVNNGLGDYIPLSGNQLGCLMLDYILSQRKAGGQLPMNGIMVQTVVTSPMGKAVAQSYGVETVETLTGFKYIGEVIKERCDSGRNKFLFGYEESYGYLAGDFVRDKDAFQAIRLVSETAALYKNQEKTLLDALSELYQRFGHYRELLINIDLPPGDFAKVEGIMSRLRGEGVLQLCGEPIAFTYDFFKQEGFDHERNQAFPLSLPVSNSIKFQTASGTWFCIRPSGTEPKMKIYGGVNDDQSKTAEGKLGQLQNELRRIVSE